MEEVKLIRDHQIAIQDKYGAKADGKYIVTPGNELLLQEAMSDLMELEISLKIGKIKISVLESVEDLKVLPALFNALMPILKD